MSEHRKATYEKMRQYLADALNDMRILSGDAVGNTGRAGWQDVAGTAAVNFQCLVWQLQEARKGNAEPFIAFPSPDDLGD